MGPPGSGLRPSGNDFDRVRKCAPHPVVKYQVVTEADRRNGILWKGSTERNAEVWRVRDLNDNSWSKWSGPGQTLPADLVFLRNVLAGNGVPGFLGAEMEKTRDAGWFYISALARIPVNELRAREVSCYAIQEDKKSPPPETFAAQKFLAKNVVPFVPLSPQKAATVQMGVYEDYTQSFKMLPVNKMLPTGSKVTPVLNEKVPVGASVNYVRQHFVVGGLGPGVQILYASPHDNGPDYLAVLVRLQDGRFGMIPGALFQHPDVFKPESDVHTPVPLSVQARLYAGPIDDFVKAFPDFVARAATAAGVNPHDYEKETAFILATAQTCSQITPQMALGVTGSDGQASLSRLENGQYEVCESPIGRMRRRQPYYISASDKVKTWNSQTERGIMFAIRPRGQGWRDGLGFTLEVYLTGLRNDETVMGSNPMATLFENYGIVRAEILN